MRRLFIVLVGGMLCASTLAAGEATVFHSEHFSDDTVVSLALAGNSTARLEGYDYDVMISISSRRDADGAVYNDPGRHRALVRCDDPAKVSVRGVDYPIGMSASGETVGWKADLWRVVCLAPIS
ncbi:hypothetical protein [Ensifer adhaerens]|uniref:hypothetical protein n=1 Tax=Ensifer adhaerens TaxID=106592 RepID=UPI000CF1A549|nr:hypothetical protein [Ensifer adhaerens]